MHALGDPRIKESKIDLILAKKLIRVKGIVITETHQYQQRLKHSAVDDLPLSLLQLIRTFIFNFV